MRKARRFIHRVQHVFQRRHPATPVSDSEQERNEHVASGAASQPHVASKPADEKLEGNKEAPAAPPQDDSLQANNGNVVTEPDRQLHQAKVESTDTPPQSDDLVQTSAPSETDNRPNAVQPVSTNKSDMSELWEEASGRFHSIIVANMTDKKGRKLKLLASLGIEYRSSKLQEKSAESDVSTWIMPDPLPEPRDVLDLLDRRSEPENLNELCSMTRVHAEEILGVIKSLGQRAAGEASSLFPGAGLCFSAFCHLLDTAQAYHEYFASLAHLFGHIKPFLQRCDEYTVNNVTIGRNLKVHLRGLLRCFVSICFRAIKLGQMTAQGKIGLFVRLLFFQEDKEMQEQLNEIDRLSSEEMGINAVTTMSGVQVLVARSADDIRTKNRLTASKRRRDEIKEALDVSVSEHELTATYNEYRKDLVRETGSWLFKTLDFGQWVHGKDSSAPRVLILKAPRHHGKTYMFSAVIQDLRQRLLAGSEQSRSSMAYFYLVNNRKSGTKDTIRDAMAAIVLQLSNSDTVFQKFAASRLALSSSLSSIEIWDEILQGYKKTLEEKGTVTTFYILVDGADPVHDDVGDSLKHIVTQASRFNSEVLHIKLLITTATTPDYIPLDDSAVVSFDLSDQNESDVKSFIRKKLQRIFGSIKNQELSKHVEDQLFKSRLPYGKLAILLDEISHCEYREDIEKILKNAPQGAQVDIEALVTDLGKTLDQESLEDFNEILPWIVLPRSWPKVTEIMAVLSLRRQKNCIVSVDKRFFDKYPYPLLEISNGKVVSFPTMEYFQEQAKTTSISPKFPDSVQQDEPYLSAPEIKLVDTFLQNSFGSDLFNKFGFAEFLASKKDPPQTIKVSFSTVEGHLRILVCCLRALEGNSRVDASALHDYAIEQIPWHLGKIEQSLDQGDRRRKEEVGRHLFLLFTSEDYMRRWLSPDYSSQTRRIWLYNENSVRHCLTWLQDTTVQQGIPTVDRTKLGQLVYGETATKDLLRETALFMARRWLEDDEWEVTSAFRWVHGYVAKYVSNYIEDSSSDGDVREPIISLWNIVYAEQWARKVLKPTECDLMWRTRYAETLLQFHYHAACKDSCEIVLARDNHFWRAAWCLVQADCKLRKPNDEHLRQVQSLMKIANEDEELGKVNKEKRWKAMSQLAGDLKAQLGNPNQAIQEYKTLLTAAPRDYNTMRKIIDRLIENERFREVVEFLKELRENGDGTAPDRSTGLFCHFATSNDFHHQIALACRKGSEITQLPNKEQNLGDPDACGTKPESDDIKKVDVEWLESSLVLISSIFDQAEEYSSEDQKEVANLRHYHGLLHYYQEPGIADAKKAISLWEQNVNTLDGAAVGPIRLESAANLSMAYLNMCKAAAWAKETIDHCFERMGVLRQQQQDIPLYITDFLTARLLYQHGDVSAAVDLIRRYVRSALEILTDNDPDNDWDGYTLLGNVLSCVDKENAIAAWSLVVPHREDASEIVPKDYQKDESDTQSNNQVHPARPFTSYGPFVATCDGMCGRCWTFADDAYFCRDCVDIALDEKCYKKLQDGKLEFRVCDKEHDFIHLPKWDLNRISTYEQKKVMVGDSPKPIVEWLSELAKKYGCEYTQPEQKAVATLVPEDMVETGQQDTSGNLRTQTTHASAPTDLETET